VRLFLGDFFVARTQIAATFPGDEISLSFGLDDRVRVSRERLAPEPPKLVLDEMTQTSQWFRIRIENFSGTAIHAAVIDQIPTSDSKEVTVELDPESTPTSASLKKDRPGTLRWNLSLADGGASDVRFGYKIRYPVGKAVSGL
jgi:uncharacterized protein (TIGR02231 family)